MDDRVWSHTQLETCKSANLPANQEGGGSEGSALRMSWVGHGSGCVWENAETGWCVLLILGWRGTKVGRVDDHER
jgi:hypothetical protein